MKSSNYEKAWQLAQSRHQQRFQAQSFLSVDDLNQQQIKNVIALALQMKRSPQDFRQGLAGKKVALLFQKTSTRTRCSFETGIYEMGGFSTWISWESSNFISADLGHEVRVLSHYYDALMARVNQHRSLEIMVEHSHVPVINGMSEKEHPCQAISDVMTLCEYFGQNLNGLRLLFMGDATNNVCASLLLITKHLGVEMAVSSPLNYRPALAQVQAFENPQEAVAWADVLYTNAWVAIGYESETEKRLRDLAAYQVNERLLEQCRKQVLVMHCLPAHVDEEISAGVITSAQSIVFDQAENRVHSQKALLYLLLNNSS